MASDEVKPLKEEECGELEAIVANGSDRSRAQSLVDALRRAVATIRFFREENARLRADLDALRKFRAIQEGRTEP